MTYLGGWHQDLQEIFGFNPTETDTFYPSDRNSISYQGKNYEVRDYATVIKNKTAQVEATYLKDFYENTAAITSHSYKEGKTYFIGARLEKGFHRDFYQNIISELDLERELPVVHGEGVSVQVRKMIKRTMCL